MAAPVNKTKFMQDINAPIKAIYGGGLMFSKDNLSNVISVDIVDGGQPFEVTGTVAGTVIRSDGTTVPVGTGAISGNTVSLTLTEACFDVPGQIVVNIIVTNGDVKCCVLRAVYTVVPTETSAVVDPGDILPSIADLIDDIDAAVASIPADYSGLLASIAGTFSASTAYVVGSYVWYDGTLYRFTAAHAAGSWTGSDATAVTIGGELADLKSAIDDVVNGKDERYEAVTMTSGYYIKSGNVYNVDLTPIAYASSQYAIVDCAPGDTFVLNGVHSANYDRAWVFVGSNNNNVITPTATTGTISGTIVAPEGAVKVIFNDIYPSSGTIKKYIPAQVGLEQIKEDVQENTENIASLLTDTESARKAINSLDVDKVGFYLIHKEYVNGDTGAFVPYASSPEWSRSDYISVDNAVDLIINTTRQGGDNAFYNANKEYVSKIQLYNGENKIAVPANAKYAVFSSRTTDMESLTIRREYIGQAVRESETAYNADLMYGVTDFGTIYNVGSGKTYETISAAMTAWATANYPYATIFIDPGEYKEAVTIESGHEINLIGSGIDSTIIHTTSGNYVDAPITIFHGTVTVKNMTLLADHSENPNFDHEVPQYLKAYGIHIDHGSVGGVVTVEKCKIISYQAPAVGTGTIPNSKIRLIDCECYAFTAYTDDTSTHQYYQLHNGAILWHTSNAADYPNRGSESFEMVNVKAYNKNDYCVLRLVKNQDEDEMSLLAINTTLVKGIETWQNPILGSVPIAEGSAYNNYSTINYSN